MKVMALDLASHTGFAIGAPGDVRPVSGSMRFAAPGASYEAMFAGALAWTSTTIEAHKPDLIVWEEPLPTFMRTGRTTAKVTTILYGLPAVVGAVAFLKGVYDIRKAPPRDVRMHFIGGNPKREIGKRLTIQKCQTLGWGVTDDNEADALALWSYQCALIEPTTSLRVSPLFVPRPRIHA